MKNNDGGSVKAPSCQEKRRDEDDLYMVVKDNDGERNEYVSVCLRKRRIEEDELTVYTIFGEMNSIVYIFKCSYLCKVIILFETYFYTTP